MADSRETHLEGRVSVITGASSGIGAAAARALATRGARVVLAARNADKLDTLVTEIRDAGGTATASVTDVTRLDDVEGLIDFAVGAYGPVDHLVNNAGLMLFSKWSDGAVDDWDKMIDTNLRGYLHAISAVLPDMIARRSGHILNLSPVAGIRVGHASGVHSATKFFIRGITDSLRQEVGITHGIQVSMISPGFIDTGWVERSPTPRASRSPRTSTRARSTRIGWPTPSSTPSTSPPRSPSTTSSSTPPARSGNPTPAP
ncbi:SDR family oxidoreductase [Streptomyces sp. NPDC048751]|uniref:SDR family oxidoreductase n=1 Tax=Streptomyces sp. NPDC048751 TaxID=3365591 RepID=UPI003713DE64